MRVNGLLASVALVAAIAGTSLLTSLAASSAYASGAGNFSIERSIPTYALQWENPLIQQIPQYPLFGP